MAILEPIYLFIYLALSIRKATAVTTTTLREEEEEEAAEE